MRLFNLNFICFYLLLFQISNLKIYNLHKHKLFRTALELQLSSLPFACIRFRCWGNHFTSTCLRINCIVLHWISIGESLCPLASKFLWNETRWDSESPFAWCFHSVDSTANNTTIRQDCVNRQITNQPGSLCFQLFKLSSLQWDGTYSTATKSSVVIYGVYLRVSYCVSYSSNAKRMRF